MKIEVTLYMGELAIDVVLQTRTLETHSRMQQLTNGDVGDLKRFLRKAGNDSLELIVNNTDSKTP